MRWSMCCRRRGGAERARWQADAVGKGPRQGYTCSEGQTGGESSRTRSKDEEEGGGDGRRCGVDGGEGGAKGGCRCGKGSGERSRSKGLGRIVGEKTGTACMPGGASTY